MSKEIKKLEGKLPTITHFTSSGNGNNLYKVQYECGCHSFFSNIDYNDAFCRKCGIKLRWSIDGQDLPSIVSLDSILQLAAQKLRDNWKEEL